MLITINGPILSVFFSIFKVSIILRFFINIIAKIGMIKVLRMVYAIKMTFDLSSLLSKINGCRKYITPNE